MVSKVKVGLESKSGSMSSILADSSDVGREQDSGFTNGSTLGATFGVQCLAQGHLGRLIAEVGYQAADLLIRGRSDPGPNKDSFSLFLFTFDLSRDIIFVSS